MENRAFLNKPLQNDNIFITSEVKPLASITGLPTRKGLEKAVIASVTLVNVVSKSYAHLPNENFFLHAEEALINADINYKTRSINRENRSFAVDYILDDENYTVTVKNGKDKIKPMLRFTNSYDGSCRTSGRFGFYREVCSNGLHVAHAEIGFSIKHRGDMLRVVIPEIRALVQKFMDNEFYKLTRKFERLSETEIHNVPAIVEAIAEQSKLFKYAKSDLNHDPSLNARLVMQVIEREQALLNEVPNKWLVYNAFNELLHGKMKITFEAQHKADSKILELVEAY